MCDCIKTTGDDRVEIRQIEGFSKISLSDNINLEITQDTINILKIEAGGNLLKLIKTEVTDNCLNISNKNKCNWVRTYDRAINVYLHVKNIEEIHYSGYGNIETTNTIKTKIFNLNVENGFGKIKLNLETVEAYIREPLGSSDIIVNGKTLSNFIWYAAYGKIDCSEFYSNDVTVITYGTNDCSVYSSNNLYSEINYIGNVNYYGNPLNILKKNQGQGSIIKK